MCLMGPTSVGQPAGFKFGDELCNASFCHRRIPVFNCTKSTSMQGGMEAKGGDWFSAWRSG
jgi:hypothetical protein